MRTIISARCRKRLSFIAMILVMLLTIFAYQTPRKAYAAAKYWKGGFAGHTTDWNYSQNWSSIPGGAGGAGVPSAGDDVTFTSDSGYDCYLTISPTVASITNSTYTHTLVISTYTLIVSGDLLWNNGGINAGSGNLDISGNFDIDGSDYNYGTTSRVTLSGSGKTFTPSYHYGDTDDLYDLTINGTYTLITHNMTQVYDNVTIGPSGCLTISGGLIFGLSSLSPTAATLTLNGTINGDGNFQFGGDNGNFLSMGSAGTIESTFTFSTISSKSIPARTFDGPVVITDNGVGVAPIITFGTDAGQTFNFNGGLTVASKYSTTVVTLDFSTYNPTVNAAGAHFRPTLNAKEVLNMGTGIWTIDESFDAYNSACNINAGTSKVIMVGENGKIDLGYRYSGDSIQTLYDVQISADVQFIDKPLNISHNLTVDNSDTFNLKNGILYMLKGSTAVINGTLDTGYMEVRFVDSAGTGVTSIGNIVGAIFFTPETENITVPATTYAARVAVENTSGSNWAADLGTGGGQTFSAPSLYISSRGLGDIILDATSYNPNVTLSNDFRFLYEGDGVKQLLMGSGTWNVAGSLNLSGGTVDASQATINVSHSANPRLSVLGVANTSTYAMVQYGDYLIAGGSMDGAIGNYIEKWDGTSWTPLGAGVNSDVTSMYVFNNELYVGGYFTQAGGAACDSIAKWNGTTWSCVGGGIEYGVESITSFNNDLVIGGWFDTTANYAARLNSGSWEALGSALDDVAYALEVYNGSLYAGGYFTGGIAKWNGSEWEAVGDGLNNTVNSLAVFDGKLIAGGYFDHNQAGTVTRHFVASWDDGSSNWTDMNPSLVEIWANRIESLFVYNNELYAGGVLFDADVVADHILIKWNGSSWNDITPRHYDWGINVLAEYNDALIFGGWGLYGNNDYSYIYSLGLDPSIISGGNTIANLSVSTTNPVTLGDSITLSGTFTDNTGDSNVKFHSGSIYTFPIIDIDGTSGHPIILEGTSNSAWDFDVAAALPTVSYVTASYSDASGGSEILANDGTSTDGGHNVHWLFGGSPPIVVDHVIVTPLSATVAIGETQTFTAKTYDAGNVEIPGKTFTWSAVVGGGSIDSSSGVFTAGSTPGTYTNTVQATTDGVNGFATVIVSSTPPPPPSLLTPPSPPPADGRGGGGEGLPTPSQLVAAAKVATLLDNITDDSNNDKHLLGSSNTPEVYGHYPIFSGTAEPTTKLTIKVIEDKNGAEVVNDTFYSGPDGNWHYQTKKYLEDGGYQVSISETEGTSSSWYKFVVKTNASEQVSQIGQDVRVSFKDIVNALKESNSNLLNIILLIITAILMINGLINAFSSFFSAEIATRQYFLAFFNSFFVVDGRREKIGFVFDSASRKKIKGALVSLFKSEMLKLLGTALTDKNGRYVFSVDKGEYTLLVKKSGYIFPSQYRVQTSENYYGQQLTYNQNLNVVREIIPIDPANNAVRKESIYFKIYVAIFTSAVIRWVVLLAGTLIAIFAFIINTANVNFVILGCYVFLYVWEFILQHKESTYCCVVDATNGKPVDLALIRIYNQAHKLCQTYVTDRQGRVNPYTEERNCVLVVERVGYQKTEQYALTPGAILSRKIYLRPA